MRSFSTFAILTSSLLAREAIASAVPAHNHAHKHKRDYYVEVDEVIVTAEVVVTDMGSGVFATGGAENIGTATIDGTAVLVTATASVAPSSSPVAVIAAPVASSTSLEAAVFVAPAPTTSEVYVAPVISTSTTPAPEPTTSSIYVASVVPTTMITSATAIIPTTSSTSIAVATTAASSSSKRGVAYNTASLTDAFSTGMSWAYNWGSDAGGTILSTLEYVPMLWGLDTSDTGNWDTKVTAALASGSTHLLGFNEPDYSGQADLTPAEAAAGWLTYMEPYASQAALVGPAVTNGGGEMGLTWLANWVAACSTCTYDAVAIHWYNGGTIDDFTAYISEAYTAGGNKPLWVSEFQASGTEAEQETFLTAAMAFMDASSMVERYAYFMAADGNLISGTGLSALGEVYVA